MSENQENIEKEPPKETKPDISKMEYRYLGNSGLKVSVKKK